MTLVREPHKLSSASGVRERELTGRAQSNAGPGPGPTRDDSMPEGAPMRRATEVESSVECTMRARPRYNSNEEDSPPAGRSSTRGSFALKDSTIITHADVYIGAPIDSSLNTVMMTSDSSPTLQATMQSASVVDLPDEPRAGKIVPTSPVSPSSTSSRDTKFEEAVSNGAMAGAGGSEEAIEEATLPIVRSTLPSPEPRPPVERNGYKDHDRTDGVPNGLTSKPRPAQRDVDEDSCLIKCVYFTQQCCECTIV